MPEEALIEGAQAVQNELWSILILKSHSRQRKHLFGVTFLTDGMPEEEIVQPVRTEYLFGDLFCLTSSVGWLQLGRDGRVDDLLSQPQTLFTKQISCRPWEQAQ